MGWGACASGFEQLSAYVADNFHLSDDFLVGDDC